MTITEMIIQDYYIKTGKNILRLDDVKIKRGEFKVATHPITVKKQPLS
jgi:hypothetical protein